MSAPLRIKNKAEINHIAFLVIAILGVVAIISASWSGWLIHEAVVSDNAIDSAAVALIGQMVSIATLTIGGLIAMLTSTGPKPLPPPRFEGDAGPSVPVTVVNEDDNPAVTTDVGASGEDPGEAGLGDLTPEPKKKR